MPQETFTKEQFWEKLDSIGEDEVRLKVRLKHYGDASDKRELAEEWLRRKDQARVDESEASNREISLDTLRIAKSAKNAAWAAVIMAIIAIIFSGVILYLQY